MDLRLVRRWSVVDRDVTEVELIRGFIGNGNLLEALFECERRRRTVGDAVSRLENRPANLSSNVIDVDDAAAFGGGHIVCLENRAIGPDHEGCVLTAGDRDVGIPDNRTVFGARDTGIVRIHVQGNKGSLGLQNGAGAAWAGEDVGAAVGFDVRGKPGVVVRAAELQEERKTNVGSRRVLIVREIPVAGDHVHALVSRNRGP